MKKNEAELVFMYTADIGTVQALRDAAHKAVSTETYSCNLCALTYGLGMRRRWHSFVDDLPVPDAG